MIPDASQKLQQLRDYLVTERRQMVDSILAEPHSSESLAGDFVGLQNFIDTVERALAHETMLERQIGSKASPFEKPLQ